MRAPFYAMLCATALIAAACSKNDSPSSPPTSSLTVTSYWMPLTAGSQVVFDETEVMTQNGVTTDSASSTTYMTIQAGTKTMLDGKSASIIQSLATTENGMDTTFSYMALSQSDMVMYDAGMRGEEAIVQLKSPLTVGNSWQLKSSDTTRATIASISETVVTPAGTFQNCIRVSTVIGNQALGETMTMDLYFAKGVGVVRYAMQGSATASGITFVYKSDTRLKSKNF